MSGTFSIGGLVSGLDTNSIIKQLVAIEQQPIVRIQTQIAGLEKKKTAINDLRTTIQQLFNKAQDFQFSDLFNQFAATSSNEGILTSTISGTSPAQGSYDVNVIQVASATHAVSGAPLGSAINPSVALQSAGLGTAVTAGNFTINGVAFTVDPTTQSLNGILSAINSSSAGVVATYDSATDKITIENATAGDTSFINFGATTDTSNFLDAINAKAATQVTGSSGSTTVTSTRNLGAVDPNALLNTLSFAGGAATSGSFSVNGVSITVDPTTDSVNSVLQKINSSEAQVTASYDASTDTIRVTSKALGSRTINFQTGSSNFLDVTNLTSATQTAGNDAQFTINGGAVQTRNTNEFADAIGGVTLKLLSTGTSTVSVSHDDNTVVSGVQDFIKAFNDSVTAIRKAVEKGGTLENDTSIRVIENSLRSQIFNTVPGLSGQFSNLLQVGISTGDSFDSSQISQLQLNEDQFRTALAQDRQGVADLFSNSSTTGIADGFKTYLDGVVSTTGFLYQRARGGGSIDQTIQGMDDQIARLTDNVTKYQQRLRDQFTKLEEFTANYKQAGSSLAALGGGYSTLG